MTDEEVPDELPPEPEDAGEEEGDDEGPSGQRYRTQRRGGKGVRDIKTTARNGKVVSIVSVTDEDGLLMMTGRGKLQRINAKDVSIIGRNTQGVRVMGLDEGDTLIAVVRVPKEEETVETEPETPPIRTSVVNPPTCMVNYGRAASNSHLRSGQGQFVSRAAGETAGWFS